MFLCKYKYLKTEFAVPIKIIVIRYVLSQEYSSWLLIWFIVVLMQLSPSGGSGTQSLSCQDLPLLGGGGTAPPTEPSWTSGHNVHL